ncbi:MAG: WD40 repeat domain-containing protein, partial [Blastocatellia bacterium]|nr:WD40 repeat domain-containing protein [Blastocatellia bacterium]
MQDNDPNDSFESKKKDSNDEPESDFENAEIYDYEEMFADEGDSLEKEEEEEHSLEKFALLAITTAKTHLSKGEYIFAANTIRVGRSFRSTYRDPRLMSLWVEMGKIAPKEEIFSHWQLFSLREHKAPITGIAIDSKNKFLIVGSLRSEVSEDTIANTLVAYDLETKEIIKRFESIQGTTAFCLSNNEQFLVAADASDKTLKMFDVQTGSLIKSFTSHTDSITEVVITDNNFFIFSSSIDGTIKMWHIKSGLLLRTLDAGAAVTAMALSPEDRLIMSGDSNGVVKLWYAPTGECIWSLKRHKGEVSSLSFSENRKFVLSSGLDRKTYLWELNFGDFSTLLKRHTSPVASTCFTYDNG